MALVQAGKRKLLNAGRKVALVYVQAGKRYY